MNWKLIWRGLRLLFLLRVPLATLALLAALGPLALRTSLSSALSNLLDQSDYAWYFEGWGTFLVSIGAFLLAYAAVTTMNLTLYYGSERFPDRYAFPLAQKRPMVTFVVGSLCAVDLVMCVIIRTEAPKGPHVLAAILGFLAAILAVFSAKLLQIRATDPKTTRHPPPYLVFPAYKYTALQRFFDKRYCAYSDRLKRRKRRINQLSQWPLEILRHAGQGYLIDTAAPAGQLKLQSGHVFSVSLSLIAFGLYVVVGFDKGFIAAERSRIPALAFVLLFLNVACWALSALTFFFDRYRFPLLWTVAGLATLTASAPESDHFFRVEPLAGRTSFLSPAAYLGKRIEAATTAKKKVNLIFVATPGGGIQAAAWTAQVLDGLNQQINQNNATSDLFKNSICFISSVSGGSLGSLIYTASLAHLLDHPAENARESAIDEVAWGWTQPDLWRAIAPWFGRRTVDRGWALEERWIAVNHLGSERQNLQDSVLSGLPKNRDILLSDWAAMGIELPALVFNSMLVESGQHVVFSTTEYPPQNDPRGVINFYQLYPGKLIDIRVATAARLSASFPYVAPASRPEIDPYAAGFHIVDGGYYDNYGIDSLIGWLSAALAGDVADQIGDILILQIRHFDPGAIPGGSTQGWSFQTYAPISGLLSMWNAAPASRDHNELRLFLSGFNNGQHRAWLATAQFHGAPGQCAPLSWKLSRYERDCIVTAWKQLIKVDDTVGCVRDYLQRTTDGVEHPACEVQP